MSNILAFLALEDFVNEVSPVDLKVRVQSITRTIPSKSVGGDVMEWHVLVTARIDDEAIAVVSIRTGRTLALFAKDESYHYDNAELAEELIRDYLGGQGFPIFSGVWEPATVMDNLTGGTCDLWHFEDKRLMPNRG